MRLTAENAMTSLAENSGRTSSELFKHGSLVLRICKPDKVDLQTPHSRDEAYLVISGSGFFMNSGTRRPFQAGEFLFAAAGAEHRFEEFTDDFATWVIFYGPDGGEAAGA
jgi:mannose-6-phosphate isomerase-like protein (cupin superfamily)